MTNTALPVVVLGGTGKTGRRVAARLRAADRLVRIGSRSGEPPFDWDIPATWAPALAGAGAVYVAYQPDLAFPGAAERIAGLVDAATAAGVERVVLLSGRGEAGALAAEAAVQQAGLEWTVVRSSFFDQNFSESFFVEPLVAGVVAFPAGTVAEPFIDVDDVAEVATAALTGDRHRGQVYEVTGPELLNFDDAVAAIGVATGRAIAYVPITPDAFAAGLRAEGIPDEVAVGYADLFATVLDGRNASVADGVGRALGRPPGTFLDYAAAAAATGVWDRPGTAGAGIGSQAGKMMRP
ncbi:MAG: NAD(P)H-binding protein [Acidimicrobiales bacterium]